MVVILCEPEEVFSFATFAIVRDDYFRPILLNMIDSYDDIRFESTSSCSHKITVASMELKFHFFQPML